MILYLSQNSVWPFMRNQMFDGLSALPNVLSALLESCMESITEFTSALKSFNVSPGGETDLTIGVDDFANPETRTILSP